MTSTTRIATYGWMGEDSFPVLGWLLAHGWIYGRMLTANRKYRLPQAPVYTMPKAPAYRMK